MMRKTDLATVDEHTASEASLNRADWIGAALSLLIEEGIDAVRITQLAERLAVTRGSFYWHFSNREDLCNAMMAHWERTNTAAVLSAVEGSDNLDQGVLALFDAWLDTTRFDPWLDAAMRDWARRSEQVRAAVERADEARIAAISDMFEAHGVQTVEAFIRARIIYFTQVGYYALGIEETLVQRFEYLEAYFLGFTGRKLNPDLAAIYRDKHLNRPVGHALRRAVS